MRAPGGGIVGTIDRDVLPDILGGLLVDARPLLTTGHPGTAG